MPDRECDSKRIVIDDGRNAVGIGGPVDQDQRQSVGDAFRDDGVVPPRGRKDQPVDLAGAHGRDGFSFAGRDIVGIAENGAIAVGAEGVLDAPDDRRE